jgi:hypothetical protein
MIWSQDSDWFLDAEQQNPPVIKMFVNDGAYDQTLFQRYMTFGKSQMAATGDVQIPPDVQARIERPSEGDGEPHRDSSITALRCLCPEL